MTVAPATQPQLQVFPFQLCKLGGSRNCRSLSVLTCKSFLISCCLCALETDVTVLHPAIRPRVPWDWQTPEQKCQSQENIDFRHRAPKSNQISVISAHDLFPYEWIYAQLNPWLPYHLVCACAVFSIIIGEFQSINFSMIEFGSESYFTYARRTYRICVFSRTNPNRKVGKKKGGHRTSLTSSP